jgi:hypothetical protein
MDHCGNISEGRHRQSIPRTKPFPLLSELRTRTHTDRIDCLQGTAAEDGLRVYKEAAAAGLATIPPPPQHMSSQIPETS